MPAYEYMRKYFIEGALVEAEYEMSFDNAYRFLESLHVLDYIHFRMQELDHSLVPKIERILRKMFVAVKARLKKMYGGKMMYFFGSRTPEDNKKKAILHYIDEFYERDRLMNYIEYIFYDETSGKLLFSYNKMPLDMKYFRTMEGFTPRDIAVALMRLKPMDFKRDIELEHECQERGFTLNSWRESRLEDIAYAVRKQLEDASWSEIADVLIAGRYPPRDRESKMEAGLVKMYEKILEWNPLRDPIREQSSLMSRALQHAHHAEPVMATKIGLDEKDLRNLNEIEVLPSHDYEENERHYMRLGRSDRNEGERKWLLSLAKKHGITL